MTDFSSPSRDYRRMVLEAAYDTLVREYDRISKLFEPTERNPLGKDNALRLRGNFEQSWEATRISLEHIKSALNDNDLATGWREYVLLKTQLMPSFASELLAVIGGIYLSQQSLDSIGDSGEAQDNLSFTQLAEQLVTDLDNRSLLGWKSVLIVGEERLGYSESQVIRLRFPSCDIWHLPFTAHEYAYVCANRNIDRLQRFADFRNEVRRQVLLDGVAVGSPPQDSQCYLPEVREFWKRYHSPETTADQREQMLSSSRDELQRRARQQVAHLCRLFADTFATFFVGPAYVHALMTLRFMPTEALDQPSPDLPPLTLRVLFALETLRWMDTLDVNEPGLFSDELNDKDASPISDGLLMLWLQTRLAADTSRKPRNEEELKAEYRALVQQYEPWLKRLHEALRVLSSSGKDTLRNWKEAEQLYPQLSNPVLKVKSRPDPWVTINAAWTARWANPSVLVQIARNALRLLNPKDKSVIGEPSGQEGDRDARSQAARFTFDQAADILYDALTRVDDKLIDVLDDFKKTGSNRAAIGTAIRKESDPQLRTRAEQAIEVILDQLRKEGKL